MSSKEAARFMVPLNAMLYPIVAIAITGLYAAWHRAQLARDRGPQHVLRTRVAYMLWVAANRA
jgi:hypothetical protein